jgi:hypothetical protein
MTRRLGHRDAGRRRGPGVSDSIFGHAACHGERFGRPSSTDQMDRRMGWLRSIWAAGLLWWPSPQSARQRPSPSGFLFCTLWPPIFSPRSCSSPAARGNGVTGQSMVVIWRTCAVERQRQDRRINSCPDEARAGDALRKRTARRGVRICEL